MCQRVPNESPPALILLSHGSLLCGATQALSEHAERLRTSRAWLCVEAGFLNYSKPDFLQAVAQCAAHGACRIVVQPYFLVSGKFVTEDLPRVIAEARTAFPNIEFILGEALGYDALLTEAVLELARDARPPQRWREDLLRAPDFCTGRPECPLYGSEHCPISLAEPQP